MSRIAILLPLFALTACPPSEDDTGTGLTGTLPAPDDWSTCRTDDGFDFSITRAETTTGVDPVRVEGNTLLVDVGYGGGCATHEWAICWPDQSFAESEPVQAFLEVWHGGEPDYCDAYLWETLEFDLTPLHDSWQSMYGADGGTILINLGGYQVEYSFDG